MKFENKYLKYKNKYCTLKNMIGGAIPQTVFNHLIREEITQAEYNLLSQDQQNEYKISTTISPGHQMGMIQVPTYIKKTKEYIIREQTELEIFNRTGQITQEEYNILLPEHTKWYIQLKKAEWSMKEQQSYDYYTYKKMTPEEKNTITTNIFKLKNINETMYNLLPRDQQAQYEIASRYIFDSPSEWVVDLKDIIFYTKRIQGRKTNVKEIKVNRTKYDELLNMLEDKEIV